MNFFKFFLLLQLFLAPFVFSEAKMPDNKYFKIGGHDKIEFGDVYLGMKIPVNQYLSGDFKIADFEIEKKYSIPIINLMAKECYKHIPKGEKYYAFNRNHEYNFKINTWIKNKFPIKSIILNNARNNIPAKKRYVHELILNSEDRVVYMKSKRVFKGALSQAELLSAIKNQFGQSLSDPYKRQSATAVYAYYLYDEYFLSKSSKLLQFNDSLVSRVNEDILGKNRNDEDSYYIQAVSVTRPLILFNAYKWMPIRTILEDGLSECKSEIEKAANDILYPKNEFKIDI
ncbi:hypothetical protein [Shewanella psychrotolerans]|uniref:hypothetical protein n=1 Tax=Shewanella psychrotolerans TaxID=2864206 RepID=UPI001C65B1A6|nr:hypothetical protein [Shewanella psychrotolerans]QYJ99752.1 hypothetical protein K0I62_09720 [Shewanella psychrotolerans]